MDGDPGARGGPDRPQVKPVVFSPEAVTELAEAVAWYGARGEGLGTRFLDEIDHLLTLLGDHPHAFPKLLGIPQDLEVRRALLPRFPFALVLIERPEEARVLAVAHVRRRPGYWLHRVRTR